MAGAAAWGSATAPGLGGGSRLDGRSLRSSIWPRAAPHPPPPLLKAWARGTASHSCWQMRLSSGIFPVLPRVVLRTEMRNSQLSLTWLLALVFHHLQFSHSVLSDSVTPWTAACQASLSITNSQSLLKLMSIKSLMPSNHLILCCPLLLCLQSFPASGSFPVSQFFTSDGQSIGASASVLPMNIQDWFPLGWTGWISFQSKRLSRVFSNTTVQKYLYSSALNFLYSPTLTSIHDYWKNHSFD